MDLQTNPNQTLEQQTTENTQALQALSNNTKAERIDQLATITSTGSWFLVPWETFYIRFQLADGREMMWWSDKAEEAYRNLGYSHKTVHLTGFVRKSTGRLFRVNVEVVEQQPTQAIHPADGGVKSLVTPAISTKEGITMEKYNSRKDAAKAGKKAFGEGNFKVVPTEDGKYIVVELTAEEKAAAQGQAASPTAEATPATDSTDVLQHGASAEASLVDKVVGDAEPTAEPEGNGVQIVPNGAATTPGDQYTGTLKERLAKIKADRKAQLDALKKEEEDLKAQAKKEKEDAKKKKEEAKSAGVTVRDTYGRFDSYTEALQASLSNNVFPTVNDLADASNKLYITKSGKAEKGDNLKESKVVANIATKVLSNMGFLRVINGKIRVALVPGDIFWEQMEKNDKANAEATPEPKTEDTAAEATPATDSPVESTEQTAGQAS